MAEANVRVVLRALNRVQEGIVRGISLEATSILKSAPSEGGTPVDTGWARVNWVPSVGTPFQGTVGTRAQAKKGQVSEATSSEGEARVATSYRLEQGPVFLSNNVPYINRLNDGHSKQAPVGFIQAAVQRAVDRFSGRQYS